MCKGLTLLQPSFGSDVLHVISWPRAVRRCASDELWRVECMVDERSQWCTVVVPAALGLRRDEIADVLAEACSLSFVLEGAIESPYGGRTQVEVLNLEFLGLVGGRSLFAQELVRLYAKSSTINVRDARMEAAQ
jgi:hypothetical protein